MGPSKKTNRCAAHLIASQTPREKKSILDEDTLTLPRRPVAAQVNHSESTPEVLTQPIHLPALYTRPDQLPTFATQPDHLSSPCIVTNSGAIPVLGKKRVRGLTRGKNVEKIRKERGDRIPVTLNCFTRAIEGDYATPLAAALGQQIQVHAPVQNDGWLEISFGLKESIVTRVGQTFDFGDYNNDVDVRCIIGHKCQTLYNEWKSRLHTHYKSLKEDKVSDLKSQTLYPCMKDDWDWMIDNLWETDDWKAKLKNAMKARGCVKYNHTSGSRSFASRASILHATMVSKIAEQSQPSVTHPLSEEQISREVLGKRSVYLKGYGIRKDSTSSSTHFEAPNSEAQNMSTMQTIIQMLAAKNGIDLANIQGLVPSNNVGEDASGVREDETSLDSYVYQWGLVQVERDLGRLSKGLEFEPLWMQQTPLEEDPAYAPGSFLGGLILGPINLGIPFFLDLAENIRDTEFLGYDTFSTRTVVEALLVNGKPVLQVSKGSEVEVFLNRTPFYAESGGQIRDNGFLFISQAGNQQTVVIEIKDIKKSVGNIFVHKGTIKKGSIEVGGEVEAAVDAKLRQRAKVHHTVTHLLQVVLKKVIGQETSQTGSLVAFDRLRFDFNFHRPLLDNELMEIEELINSWIEDSTLLQTKVMPLTGAKKAGAIAMFGEKYGEQVRVVKVPSVSMELFGGTHVSSTSEIRGLKIISKQGIASGIRRIEAVAEIHSAKVKDEDVPAKVETLLEELRMARNEISAIRANAAVHRASIIANNVLLNNPVVVGIACLYLADRAKHDELAAKWTLRFAR
ncbi:unnamed protein product [Camellia sinensis]